MVFHAGEEGRVGLVAEVEVALHGEVRRIDLEQVPAPDDERVFRLQLPRQREEVVAVRRVVGVLHDGQHAAGRGRGHKGLGEALLLPGERVFEGPRTPRARRRRRSRSAPRRPLGARSRCVSVPPGWCGRPRGRPPRRAGISENPADRCGSSYRRSRSCAAPGRSNSRRGPARRRRRCRCRFRAGLRRRAGYARESRRRAQPGRLVCRAPAGSAARLAPDCAPGCRRGW